MSHFICRLVDKSGHVKHVVPIIVSTQADAVAVARTMLARDAECASFELWQDQRRLIAHGEAAEGGADPKQG